MIMYQCIALYPKRGNYISCIKFKCGLKDSEFEMRPNEKSAPPCKSSRPNLKK